MDPALPQPQPSSDFKLCQHKGSRLALMTQCLQNSIETIIEQYLDIGQPKSRELAACIVGQDVSVRELITSATNSPPHETNEELAMCLIQDLADRFEHLNSHQEFAHLLISLPTEKSVCLDGAFREIDESTMRRLQFEQYAHHHSNITATGLNSPQSNVALIEVHSDISLYSVLDKFLNVMSTKPANFLFVVLNGHGTKKGELVLWEGRNVHVNTMIEAMQTFRKSIDLPECGTLQYVHVIYAQCYSYKIDVEAALGCDLVNNVTWLTSDEPGQRKTNNSRRSDGQIVHDELMQFKQQTKTFHSLDIQRQLHGLDQKLRHERRSARLQKAYEETQENRVAAKKVREKQVRRAFEKAEICHAKKVFVLEETTYKENFKEFSELREAFGSFKAKREYERRAFEGKWYCFIESWESLGGQTKAVFEQQEENRSLAKEGHSHTVLDTKIGKCLDILQHLRQRVKHVKYVLRVCSRQETGRAL